MRATRKPLETEKSFMQAVIDLARLHQWKAYHTFNSQKSEPGFPDLVMARAGSPVLFVECKLEHRKLTKAQRAWLEALWQADDHMEALVWRPSSWDGIVETLKRR